MACCLRSLRSLPVYNVLTILYFCMFCRCMFNVHSPLQMGISVQVEWEEVSVWIPSVLFSPLVLNVYWEGLYIKMATNADVDANTKIKQIKAKHLHFKHPLSFTFPQYHIYIILCQHVLSRPQSVDSEIYSKLT